MKIRNSLLAVACAVGMIAVLAAPAGASSPINVVNDHLTCNSVVGTIKFSPPLISGGFLPGSMAVKATVAGCTDNDNGSVEVLSGTMSGTLSIATNDCGSLLGLSTGTAGVLTTKWKTITGSSKITPTATDFSIAQTNWDLFGPASWGASYFEVQIGTTFGTSQPHITGANDAFSGGNDGHSSSLDATTGQDTSAFGTACLVGGGVKALNFGIGGFTFG